MKHLYKRVASGVGSVVVLIGMQAIANSQMSKVKTVFVIMLENHNWTGNDAGASFGDPDLKDNPLAPYINGTLAEISAHAEQYYNPPGNHPSQPNYLWLQAGTNFGVLADTQPGQPQLFTHLHLTRLLEDAGITWKNYAEPDFGSPVFDVCPLDFTYLDVEHLAPVYFNDVNDGLNPNSKECIEHVVPYYQLATDLADNTTAQYILINPNLCHQGHEGISPCDSQEPADNTLRMDTWLKQNVPLILESQAYKQGGALFITWDEAEDSDQFSDGPIPLFVISQFAKGGGKTGYSNSIHYSHSSTLKTIEEIFGVTPLLGDAANPETNDLSDLFK
jgi:phosphatidylinositol-3-phosphatase